MKKKVLMFLQSGVGGAERVTVTIGKNLDREKFEVSFCLVGDAKGVLNIENFIPKEYTLLRIPKCRGLRLILALKKIVSREKPDVVFSSITFVNTKLLALAPFFPKIKFVVRNNNYIYTLSAIQKLVLRVFYRFADAVIAQTDEMSLELTDKIKLPKKKVYALQNPIDEMTIDEKKNAPSPFVENGDVVYVASGRCQPVKGFDILVKAFRFVLNQQPNARLHILGKITENCEACYIEVLKLAKELGVSDKVFFEGFQLNPYVFVKNADCFVLSSRNEGLPNVLIESLYLETPVAATKCIPVISRIVENGVNGFLAEPEDAESLASAMLKASKLGRVSSSYHSASMNEFQRIIEND
ncbi:glycosyltransferase [uncultured Fibrobacter sp.]|uniref:glycosyltransferase n=1 Tax=uncultured Fibrobacter sp. TaxID=261512 RepID=UPI00263497FC|nr:glycosyltransferase [uncultured Fibrobacter sp.]